MLKILVVDDEPDIRNLLEHFLAGKERRVITASDGQSALAQFEAEAPDLVILDVMMPGLNGWDVLARLRERSDVPIIMLTARDTALDSAKGLLGGADDYIRKPFDLGELEARIMAVLRRIHKPEIPEHLAVGELAIDDTTKEVTLRGDPVKLSPKEYDLLWLLASRPGRVFSHEEIIAHVWQDKHFISAKDVIKYVNLLRGKVEDDPKDPRFILNVRGFGYKLAS